MKIKFPFAISQLDDNTIEIVDNIHGEPLLTLNPHPVLTVSDTDMDAIYNAALAALIKASISVFS